MSVNSKMTAIANATRALDGSTAALTLDGIASKLGVEKTNIDAALAAIAEKGVDVPAGSKSDALASLIAAIEAGGGGDGSTLWGGKYTTGSFVLSEETTSEYIIATDTDDAMQGLLEEGENLAGAYTSIGLLVVKKAGEKPNDMSEYANSMYVSICLPIHYGSGSLSSKTVGYFDTYSTNRGTAGSGSGGAQVSNRKLSVIFNASYKGSPIFEYLWLAWRHLK